MILAIIISLIAGFAAGVLVCRNNAKTVEADINALQNEREQLVKKLTDAQAALRAKL